MSFQIFAISERSKFWKQIAGKSLKANRWKNFESSLKANRWKIFESFLKANRWKTFESKSLENFWKLFESKSLENFWKLFESKSLENFWKQIAGKFLKAFWKLSHIVFATAAVRLGQIPLHLREKIVRLINEGKSQREVHRRRTENNCYFADPLPMYLLITVKTKLTHVSTHVPLRCCRRTGRWGRTAGEEAIHSLEDERSRLIIDMGL